MTTTEKAPHTLIVEDCGAGHTEHDSGCWTYKLECPGVTDTCRMYLECMDCNDRVSGAEDDDLYDELTSTGEAHGVEHRWTGDAGWATRTEECFAVRAEDLYETAEDLRLSPGRYPVAVSFEDGEYLRLRLVGSEVSA